MLSKVKITINVKEYFAYSIKPKNLDKFFCIQW